MTSLVKKFVALGVTPELSVQETRTLKFTNIFCFLATVLFVYFVCFGIYTGMYFFIGASILATLGLLTVPVLNSRKYYAAARLVFANVAVSYVVFSSIYGPTSDYSPIFFYCCLAGAFLVFPPSEKWRMWFTIGIIMTCFILVILVWKKDYFDNLESVFFIPDAFGALFCFLGLGWIYRYVMSQTDSQVVSEQDKIEALLHNILPERFLNKLKEQPGLTFERHENVSVINIDIVDFTVLADKVEPEELILFLNRIFSFFDEVAGRYGLEKIKTVGDAYIAVGGIDAPDRSYLKNVIMATLDVMEGVKSIKGPDQKPVCVRIGVGYGNAITGVIGVRRFAYSIWGDAVTVALAMEHTAPDGHVKVSNEIYELLAVDYTFTYAGEVDVSGKMVKTWLLSR